MAPTQLPPGACARLAAVFLILADLGGEFAGGGCAEYHWRAGLAPPGVQDATDAGPCFPSAGKLAAQRRERVRRLVRGMLVAGMIVHGSPPVTAVGDQGRGWR